MWKKFAITVTFHIRQDILFGRKIIETWRVDGGAFIFILVQLLRTRFLWQWKSPDLVPAVFTHPPLSPHSPPPPPITPIASTHPQCLCPPSTAARGTVREVSWFPCQRTTAVCELPPHVTRLTANIICLVCISKKSCEHEGINRSEKDHLIRDIKRMDLESVSI